jgi:hypothetical protein
MRAVWLRGYVEHYNNVRLNSVPGRMHFPLSDLCQRYRLHHAEGHARRALAGDSGRAGSEVESGEGTAEELPPAGRVTDETDYFRSADNPGVMPRVGPLGQSKSDQRVIQ